MRQTCAIVPATQNSVRHICAHLRALDMAEVAALHGVDQGAVPAIVLGDWQMHDAVFVLQRGATPLCMFGASRHPEDDAAFIWMVGTDDMGAKDLVRYGKHVVQDYLQRYASLFCLVWAQHHVSIAWLKHLGFHTGMQMHVHNAACVLMVKHREDRVCVTP